MAKEATREDLLYFNGVNGTTGTYGLPPMSAKDLSRFVRGEAAPENLSELRFRQERGKGHYGVKEGVDPRKLEQAGWGVVFTHDGDPEVREALAPLLELRREQAGERFRVYYGSNGLRPGETKTKFLARHGAGPGPADPEKVPYYLLLVGSPEAIPYRFQSQLDVQYAVGRICFETPRDHASYAASVVAAERGEARRPRKVAFFGVENADDPATRLSSRHLVQPLLQHVEAERPDWQVNSYSKEEATKANLARLLGGGQTPALLFTASHGLEFRPGDARQLPHQGAILCRDWPGPVAWHGQGAIPQDFYFAGDDLTADAGLAGLIGFSFACYGAGTPRHDEFAKQAFKDARQEIAPHAFLAGLPTKMLAHPKGGALAFIGHVERAWGYSFLWQGAGAQTTVFESALDRLLAGHPVGSALEYFDQRYAELSTVLADQLEEIEFGMAADPYELAGMWTANNDARGYVILGDPAVRLPVADPGEAPVEGPGRSAIELRDRDVSSKRGERLDSTDASVDFSAGAQPADDEEVHFSAYHPSLVPLGERRQLLVYAHLEAAAKAVASDAGQVFGDDSEEIRQARAEAEAALAFGTEITVVPWAEGLAFEPASARITWQAAWQRADFEMAATGERTGAVEGSIACYAGPLLIAELALPVTVQAAGGETATVAEREVRTAAMYRSVFASYAHDDAAVVESMETACKALGMDYLRDVVTLRSGQRWSDELCRMIERADIVQLFWSEAASRSRYVEQEWRHALGMAARKGSAFIRPVYWHEPLAPVPAELAQIHFARIELDGSPAGQRLAISAPALPRRALAADDDDLVTLTISTYAVTDPADPGDRRLAARTRIALAGDTEVQVGEDASNAQLELHAKTVREAVRARLAYLELIGR